MRSRASAHVDHRYQLKPGSRILSYLDFNKIWEHSHSPPFVQLESNRSLSDRYPTSWSVHRGHHFFIWVKAAKSVMNMREHYAERNNLRGGPPPYPTHSTARLPNLPSVRHSLSSTASIAMSSMFIPKTSRLRRLFRPSSQAPPPYLETSHAEPAPSSSSVVHANRLPRRAMTKKNDGTPHQKSLKSWHNEAGIGKRALGMQPVKIPPLRLQHPQDSMNNDAKKHTMKRAASPREEATQAKSRVQNEDVNDKATGAPSPPPSHRRERAPMSPQCTAVRRRQHPQRSYQTLSLFATSTTQIDRDASSLNKGAFPQIGENHPSLAVSISHGQGACASSLPRSQLDPSSDADVVIPGDVAIPSASKHADSKVSNLGTSLDNLKVISDGELPLVAVPSLSSRVQRETRGGSDMELAVGAQSSHISRFKCTGWRPLSSSIASNASSRHSRLLCDASVPSEHSYEGMPLAEYEGPSSQGWHSGCSEQENDAHASRPIDDQSKSPRVTRPLEASQNQQGSARDQEEDRNPRIHRQPTNPRRNKPPYAMTSQFPASSVSNANAHGPAWHSSSCSVQ